MMGNIKYPTNPRKLIKLLEENGWRYAYSSGSHKFYTHPVIKDKIPVPCHGGKDIAPGTVNQIIKRARIK